MHLGILFLVCIFSIILTLMSIFIVEEYKKEEIKNNYKPTICFALVSIFTFVWLVLFFQEENRYIGPHILGVQKFETVEHEGTFTQVIFYNNRFINIQKVWGVVIPEGRKVELYELDTGPYYGVWFTDFHSKEAERDRSMYKIKAVEE